MATLDMNPAVPAPTAAPPWWKSLDWNQYIVYFGFLAILLFFSIVLRDDGFLTSENLLNIVMQTTPVTVMTIGMVLVLANGEIDLSIGSVVALSALCTALILRTHSAWLAVPAGLAVGACVGLFNGLFVTRLRLPSFLVTLATLGLVSGMARTLTNLASVPVSNDRFIAVFGGGSLWGVPSLVLWSLGTVAVGHFVFRETRFGAHTLAIGDNASAARVSGIKVERMRMAVMLMSSLCAALAGILYSGRLQGATYTLGESDLMTVIAAAIIGGTRLNGGVGTVVGGLLGSLTMGMLNNGLILMGLTVAQQMIVRGLIILLAVAVTLREKKS
jgi:ribose transport system permease protein